MANQDDVRRIAMSLPGVNEAPDHFAFSVTVKAKEKGFVWAWNERIEPKKPKVPHPDVVAIMVPNMMAKEFLMEEAPEKYVVDPHYIGYPAILVRLPMVEADELEDLIVEGWRTNAPKSLITELEAQAS